MKEKCSFLKDRRNSGQSSVLKGQSSVPSPQGLKHAVTNFDADCGLWTAGLDCTADCGPDAVGVDIADI